jgi:hypothetical protein
MIIVLYLFLEIIGQRCSRDEMYTYRQEYSKCDGWNDISFEECKFRCQYNWLPPDCENFNLNKTCRFIIYHFYKARVVILKKKRDFFYYHNFRSQKDVFEIKAFIN